MDYYSPGPSVHKILQTTILEWVTISFSRGSSQPRNGSQISCIAGRVFFFFFLPADSLPSEPPGKLITGFEERKLTVMLWATYREVWGSLGAESGLWPTASKKTLPCSYNDMELNLPATRMNLEKDLPGENCKLSWHLDNSLLSLSWGSSDTAQTPHSWTLRQ